MMKFRRRKALRMALTASFAVSATLLMPHLTLADPLHVEIGGGGEQVLGMELSAGVVEVAAGADHSLGLEADGSVVAWGWNNYSQTNVPSPNPGFIAIAAGD